MNEYATTLILTVVRVSLVATHAHNEQTTGMHKGGQLVPVVMANSFLGETKSGTNCLDPWPGLSDNQGSGWNESQPPRDEPNGGTAQREAPRGHVTGTRKLTNTAPASRPASLLYCLVSLQLLAVSLSS